MCGKLIAGAWSCTCRAPRIYHPSAPACSFCTSPPTGRAPTAEELAANIARVRAFVARRSTPPSPLTEAASEPQLLAPALEVLGGKVSRVKMAPYDKGAEDVPQDGHAQNEMAALGEGAENVLQVSFAHGREAQRAIHETAAPGAGAVLRESGRSAAAAAAVAPAAPRAGAGSGRGTVAAPT